MMTGRQREILAALAHSFLEGPPLRGLALEAVAVVGLVRYFGRMREFPRPVLVFVDEARAFDSLFCACGRLLGDGADELGRCSVCAHDMP